MKSRKRDLLIIIASVWLMGLDSAKPPPELIGTWDYMSVTALKNGKPFGTVRFQPGQWTVTFAEDATWIMKLPPSFSKPYSTKGTYDVHGRELDMKRAKGEHGKPNLKYRFTVEEDGKVLVLTDKESTSSASRE
jgi:hypothetical protein